MPRFSLVVYRCDVYGGVNDGKKDSEFTPKFQGNILESLVRNNFFGTSPVFINKQTFLDSGEFNETLRSIEDFKAIEESRHAKVQPWIDLLPIININMTERFP